MNKIFAAVLVMLIAAPAFAAPSGTNAQTYARLKTSNPEAYERCRTPPNFIDLSHLQNSLFASNFSS